MEVDFQQNILLTLGDIKADLGEIKGKVNDMPKMNERLSRLEIWQAWLKGGWFATASAFLWKMSFGK